MDLSTVSVSVSVSYLRILVEVLTGRGVSRLAIARMDLRTWGSMLFQATNPPIFFFSRNIHCLPRLSWTSSISTLGDGTK